MVAGHELTQSQIEGLFAKLNATVKDIVTSQFIKCGQEFNEQKQQFAQAIASIEKAKRQE
jgi:hypothetical protein